MTQQEFTHRTNLNPTPEEFDAIHALYMATNLDKDEFCEAFNKLTKHPETATMVMDAGAELHSLTKEINQLKSERRDMAIFIAEQAEVSANSDLRAKAIEMMGEVAYITWKLDNDKALWSSDRKLIKKLINH